MKNEILTYLRIVPAASAEMMAQELEQPQDQIQAALHGMDDDGDVILRQGWYRLSEAAKIRLEG
jgi:predicted transcriptional regulator